MKTNSLTLLFLTIFVLCSPLLFAQNPELVKDIFPTQLAAQVNTYNTGSLAPLGDNMIFVYEDEKYGAELYVTDGTADDARMLKDINPGPSGSNAFYFTRIGNELFFSALDGIHPGNSIYKTDGTKQGTQFVSNLNGALFNSIDNLTNVNGTLFFTVDSYELWRSDGTEAGTVLVKNFNDGTPGTTPLSPFNLQSALSGNTLYFFTQATDQQAAKLWKSDGTETGTLVISEIPGTGVGGFFSYSGQIIPYQNGVYVFGETYLYKSNGTPGDFTLVKEWFNVPDLHLINFRVVGDKLIFVNVRNGDLWSSDGTTAGTIILTNLNVSQNIYVADVFVLNGQYHVTVNDLGGTIHFWKTDGTISGTNNYHNITNLNANVTNRLLGLSNGQAYFVVFNSSSDVNLWKTDGTGSGTLNTGISMINFFNIPEQNTTDNGIFYYFAGQRPQGINILSRTDGTQAGTFPIAADAYGYDRSSYPSNFIKYNNELFFQAKDGISFLQWKSDGTAGGTVALPGVNPAIAAKEKAAVWMNQIYYSPGNNIYKTDGQNTTIIFDLPNVYNVKNLNNELFFSSFSNNAYITTDPAKLYHATNESSFEEIPLNLVDWYPLTFFGFQTTANGDVYFLTREILYQPGSTQGCCFYNRNGVYRYDGTNVYPLEYYAFSNLSQSLQSNTAAVGNAFYFTNYSKLYKTGDGSDIIQTIHERPILDYRNYNYLTEVNGKLYFTTSTASTGSELWISDGTSTYLLRDIVPGAAGSCPRRVIEVGSEVYFLIDKCNREYEIWKSDGTYTGTQLFAALPDFINVDDELNYHDGALYFVGDDGVSGDELWKITIQGNPTDGVDLELQLNANTTTPSIYSNVTFTLNISNTGTEAATGVKVSLPVPANLAFVSQTIPAGTYSNWDGIWHIGTVPAGESYTMELTLFTLTVAPIAVYAQVNQCNENDQDSTPGNGTPPTPNEDDEAAVTINGGTMPCSIDDLGLVVSCLDNGTPDNPDDDRFTFTLDISGTNLSSTYDLSSPNFSWQNVPYSSPGNAGTFLIANGGFNITVVDGSGACNETIFVTPPSPCSNNSCNINLEISPSICDNRGTLIPEDDEFIYEITATNGTAGTYTIILTNTGNGSSSSFLLRNYGQTYGYASPATLGNVIVNIIDDTDNACTATGIVTLPADCPVQTTTCANNLLVNPGYEVYNNFYDGWYSLGGTTISNDAYTGNNAVLISGTAPGGILQNKPAVVGRNYTVQMHAKSNNTASQQSGSYLSLKFLSATWQPIYTKVDFIATSTDFALYQLNYTAPANTAYVEVKVFKDAGDFQLVVDDWCLTDAAGDPCNPDFEAPVFVTCPADITVYTTANSATADWVVPTATDNCGISNLFPNYVPGLYQFPLGTTGVIYTALDYFNNQATCEFNVTVLHSNPGNGIDLELSITASDTDFRAWQYLSMTVVVNNVGSETAGNVVVDFPKPAGTVFQGGQEYTASQGNYTAHSTQKWTVGNILPGGMATITFNLFTLQEADPLIGFAQVNAMTGTDVDSTPDNGSCCVANEDDETVITLLPANNGPITRARSAEKLYAPALRQLYPNPAVWSVQMVVESPEELSLPLAVYNSVGQLQYQEMIELTAGINALELDISGLPPGMYFIHIVGAQSRHQAMPFVKERN